MTFRIGQKVARFLGGNNNRDDVRCPPIGEPVTIVNIYLHQDGELILELAEYPIPGNTVCAPGIRARFFRPIIERKTDISIFTAMLTPVPARSRELCGND